MSKPLHSGLRHESLREARCLLTGTADLWRRSAIDDAGCWHADTLTEGVALSYRALLGGWRFIYLIGQAAPAELPADMNAFKSQQFRWAKGSIQIARKLLPRVVRAPLPVPVKLEAWFHSTQNLPYLGPANEQVDR